MDDATEFLEAATQGDAGRVAGMLAARSDLVAAAGEHGKTALHWAAEADRIEVARALSTTTSRSSW
jgi:ankyrin repeat protein